jgi:hypothetical protein
VDVMSQTAEVVEALRGLSLEALRSEVARLRGLLDEMEAARAPIPLLLTTQTARHIKHQTVQQREHVAKTRERLEAMRGQMDQAAAHQASRQGHEKERGV